jgi:hypothetical protein
MMPNEAGYHIVVSDRPYAKQSGSPDAANFDVTVWLEDATPTSASLSP